MVTHFDRKCGWTIKQVWANNCVRSLSCFFLISATPYTGSSKSMSRLLSQTIRTTRRGSNQDPSRQTVRCLVIKAHIVFFSWSSLRPTSVFSWWWSLPSTSVFSWWLFLQPAASQVMHKQKQGTPVWSEEHSQHLAWDASKSGKYAINLRQLWTQAQRRPGGISVGRLGSSSENIWYGKS